MNGLQRMLQICYTLEDWATDEIHRHYLEKQTKNFSSEEWHSFCRWQIVLNYVEDNNQEQLQRSLYKLHDDCIKNKHYEIARTCDFYLVKYTKNVELAKKVFFGTPYKTIRDYILNFFPEIGEQQTYEYLISHQHSNEVVGTLDINQGLINGKPSFENQPINLKLLQTLFSDLYRPFSVYELFDEVFH